MKSLKELMSELGFKEGANEEVAKAFLKNLNHAIDQDQRPVAMKPKQDFRPGKPAVKQLSFDLSYDEQSEPVKKSS